MKTRLPLAAIAGCVLAAYPCRAKNNAADAPFGYGNYLSVNEFGNSAQTNLWTLAGSATWESSDIDTLHPSPVLTQARPVFADKEFNSDPEGVSSLILIGLGAVVLGSLAWKIAHPSPQPEPVKVRS